MTYIYKVTHESFRRTYKKAIFIKKKNYNNNNNNNNCIIIPLFIDAIRKKKL